MCLNSPLFPFPRCLLQSARTDTFENLNNDRNLRIFIARLSPAAVELRDEGLEAAARLVLALLLHYERITLPRVPVTCTEGFTFDMKS